MNRGIKELDMMSHLYDTKQDKYNKYVRTHSRNLILYIYISILLYYQDYSDGRKPVSTSILKPRRESKFTF